MKVTQKEVKVNRKDFLLACYDVSQREVHFCSEYEVNNKVYYIEDIIDNNPRAIKNHFLELDDIRRRLGLEGVNVFFEPSGGYENILKRLAFKGKFRVNQVSGEATKKARIIESNDNNKSDDKDRRIILTLAQMSKVLSCRDLPEPYLLLRQLGLYYEDVSNHGMLQRTQVADIAKCLFPEQSVRSKFLYTATGRTLVKQFGFNPFIITKYNFSYFKRRVKKYVLRVSEKTLKNIYRKAEAAKVLLTESEAEIHEQQLRWQYEKYEEIVKRKEKLKEEMSSLYASLPEYGKLSQIKQISDFQMSRVIGETGPLSDFACLSRIMRYAGLNIRVKESGKYKGENKLSKKGRPLLRKILYQIVFSSLIKKGKIYYEYFHKKKDIGTKGLVILTNLMRKTFKMIFGVFKSVLEFNIERVYSCEIEYAKRLSA